MVDKIGKMTGAEVIFACPSVGRSAALGAIKKLTEEGLILKCGSGRSTCYVRADSVQESLSSDCKLHLDDLNMVWMQQKAAERKT